MWESTDAHAAPANLTADSSPRSAMRGNTSRSMLHFLGIFLADFCDMQYMPAFIHTPGTVLFSKKPETVPPSDSTVP